MTLMLANQMPLPEISAFDGWHDRPWGAFQSLTQQGRFKVRHLVLYPEKSLGLQSHIHRSQHWVVASGCASVTIDGQQHNVFETHSIDVPVGRVHRLENPGKVDLHLIEVQVGAYLGDDDILHYEADLVAV